MFSDTKVQPTPNTQPPCNGLFARGRLYDYFASTRALK